MKTSKKFGLKFFQSDKGKSDIVFKELRRNTLDIILLKISQKDS